MEATIIGSALGAAITVIGTLLIFFLQERVRKRATRKEVIQNAIDELTYDKAMIRAAKKSIERAVEELTVGKTSLYFSHSSRSIAVVSLMNAYNEGVLLKRMTPELFARLNQNALVFLGTLRRQLKPMFRVESKHGGIMTSLHKIFTGHSPGLKILLMMQLRI